MARNTARQVADYRCSGIEVVAVVSIDGSPLCGVQCTLDIPAALDRLAAADRRTLTSNEVNAIVRGALLPGTGMFTRLLRRELRRRHIDVLYLAHDLPRELDGRPSHVPAGLHRSAGSLELE